jgi:hypothetical protein
MGLFKLLKFKVLSEWSMNSNKSGHLPQKAKFQKEFVHIGTGEVFINSDLNIRKYKRNKTVDSFGDSYELAYRKNQVSILSFVVNDDMYNSASKFIEMLVKKLKRYNIPKLGHLWVRDVGEIKFKKHFHILVALPRIESDIFNKLFNCGGEKKYKVEFMKTKRGLRNYLKKKELFGIKGQRTYGRSRLFKKPVYTE